MDSASSGGIALRSGFSEPSYQFLQKLDVCVGQDWGDQFALLAVGAADAGVLLEFPFPTLGIPCAPSAVAVPAGGVTVLVGSEELGGDLGGGASVDVVHLHLDPNGLLLHFLDLSQNLLVHAVFLRFLRVFPFGSTHIRSESEK